MQLPIDVHSFVTTPKHELGRGNRTLAEELRADLGDRAWDEFDDEALDVQFDDQGLTIIDEAEFFERYVA